MGFMDLPKQPPIPVPGERYPLFNRISIETTSYCNRACSFCPLSWGDRGRNAMAPALFEKLVAELEALKFDGSIHPFLINEPTINPNILGQIKTLRRACPQATISIATNFDVLDRWFQKSVAQGLAKVKEYYDAGLNIFSVNIYDEGPEQHARYTRWVAEIISANLARWTDHRWRRHPPKRQYIATSDMRVGRTKNSLVDNFYIRSKEERVKAIEAYCAEPHRQIVVRWDGKVPVCCAVDPTDESMMIEDVNNKSLVDAWNSDIFMQYRYHLQQKQRVMPGCNTCTFKMAYPHIVRKVQPDEETRRRWELREVTV